MKRILVVLLLLPLGLGAQIKTTQGTPIVAALNLEEHVITAIYSLNALKKDKEIMENCANCTYFLGELIGAYEQEGVLLKPKEGATITVFKEQEVFAEKTPFPNDRFKTKNEVVMAGAKAVVIENKKGELILKTKNNED